MAIPAWEHREVNGDLAMKGRLAQPCCRQSQPGLQDVYSPRLDVVGGKLLRCSRGEARSSMERDAQACVNSRFVCIS